MEASKRGNAQIVERLLVAGANVHARNDRALRRAVSHGHFPVAAVLLRAGANVAHVPWAMLTWPEAGGRTLISVPASSFLGLDDTTRARWLRLVHRPGGRLRRALERARARLDRPPTEPLGLQHPTRAELIEHLKTAGRRFAREYWLEGFPIFFSELHAQTASEPVPACFLFKVG